MTHAKHIPTQANPPPVSVKFRKPLRLRAGRRYIYATLLWLFAGATPESHAQESAKATADETQVIVTDAENSPPPPQAPQPNPNQPVAQRLAEQQRQLLSGLQGPPSSLWLPIDGQQVLAFWQPDRSGKPVGAVLMLHDKGENPRRAATLRRLHEYLPIHGWATFSIELPTLPGTTVPARTPLPPVPSPQPSGDAEEKPEETQAIDEGDVVHQEDEIADPANPAAEAPATPTQPSRAEVIEQIHRRIQAATSYLQQQGQFNLVLLGEGSSAHWVLQHLDMAAPPPAVESADKKSKGVFDRAIRAVILVNPNTPEGADLEPLSARLRHPDIPTFDVFTDLHLETLAAAQQRHQTAKQQGYENYIVRRLPPPSGAVPDRADTLLTKAIRGFLEKYAKGVEM